MKSDDVSPARRGGRYKERNSFCICVSVDEGGKAALQAMMKIPAWKSVISGKNALYLVAFILFLSSCAPSPVWEKPLEPSQERSVDKRLAGAWGQAGYPVLFIAEPLEGWMSFVVSGRGNPREKIMGKMYVSKLGGRSFLNIKIHAPWDLRSFYVIAEYRLDRDDHLFVALPNHEAVKKAVEAKRLSGRIDKDHDGTEVLVVTSESPEIRGFILESPKETLFPESPSDVVKRLR
jgi:hypothetical protein